MKSTSYPVFIDTNLQTHLVLTISNDDTVLELKKKVMSEHLNCFPGFGKIDVEAIKVERRECYYYLTDSLFAKSAFDGLNGTWHLHVDAVPQVVSREPGSSERLGEALQLKPPAKQQHTKGKKSDDVCKNVAGTPSGEKAEKKKKPSVLEEATSTVMPSEGKDLKRKLTEASLKTRKKKKMEKMRLSPTEISDGENGLSSSGAGKEVSTVDVVPETSKRVEASDADHPSGKSRKLKEKNTVAPSSCHDKASDKDRAMGDNSVNMESSKSNQKVAIPKEVNTFTDEKKKMENPPVKKMKRKSRIRKATSDSVSSKHGGIATDSLSQVPKNNELLQVPSDFLEHNLEKIHAEENRESGVGGSTNEDPKSSAVEGGGINFNDYFSPKAQTTTA